MQEPWPRPVTADWCVAFAAELGTPGARVVMVAVRVRAKGAAPSGCSVAPKEGVVPSAGGGGGAGAGDG